MCLLYSRSSVEGGCDCGGMKTVIIIFKQVMFLMASCFIMRGN